MERVFFAISALSRKSCSSTGSVNKSGPPCFLNSSFKNDIISLSQSNPPKFLSPPVANTFISFLDACIIVTSKVPPPRS
ncbi:hypothetical protein ASZ90_004738 [hydrocarbon metagenome]|uniref:Uncharacterized protein n=1 Tax=hydrocarbon metagenome TaxID=938273 RepID=A0A0W8FX81_9ZZZZ